LQPFAIYSGSPQTVFVLVSPRLSDPYHHWRIAFRHWYRCMDRLIQHNVLAMSGRAVEAARRNTLLLDKTGTTPQTGSITFCAGPVMEQELADAPSSHHSPRR
jgi:K+-transporting ATPase ATPase B chain